MTSSQCKVDGKDTNAHVMNGHYHGLKDPVLLIHHTQPASAMQEHHSLALELENWDNNFLVYN